MKLLCGSDFHGTIPVNTEEIVSQEDPEAILIAGDMAPHPWDEGSKEDVLEGLLELGVPIYAVSGNIDDPEYLKRLDEEDNDFHLLDMKSTEVGDYTIVGFSPFFTPLIVGSEGLLEEIFRGKIKDSDPEKTIVLSHLPPKDTETDFATEWGFEEHAGNEQLREVIEEFEPLLVVCGHIEEARGTDEIGDTTIVNTAEVFTSIQLEEGKKPGITFLD